ncbi:MAG: hypothetical protein HYX90_06270 [Chloroflexi bacterium]|nr:hypothetical protein [Chloroflexota bacterium]
MPGKTEHLAQADHNGAFWRSLPMDTTPYLDWVVTGIFYEGVHRVEAFLSTRGEHSERHSQRLAALQRNKTKMGTILADFETLKLESENARYRCHKYTASDISTDLVPISDKIKKHVDSILGSPPSKKP